MAQPIRVVHVLGALDRGGAETMVMNLYRNINRNKVQFDFVIHTHKQCDYTDEILAMGGHIYSVPRFKGINCIEYIHAWKSFFMAHPEDRIVHGHMRSTAAIYLEIAKRSGIYTIAHSHNVSSGKGIKACVKNVIQLPIRKIADLYFACSDSAGKWLFGKKIVESSSFRVLPNAIDVKTYCFNESKRKEKRKENGVEDKFVLLHIGRFHPQKNHEFLIDVFKEISAIKPNSVLWLVGDGELKEEIEKKVDALGLHSHVVFWGMREDVQDILQAADVFLFPSLYEGLGIVAIEAEAAGLPCICSDRVPKDICITNLVKILQIDDRKSWVEEIEKLEIEERHVDTYKQIVCAGYDIHKTAKWLEQFYLEVQR